MRATTLTWSFLEQPRGDVTWIEIEGHIYIDVNGYRAMDVNLTNGKVVVHYSLGNIGSRVKLCNAINRFFSLCKATRYRAFFKDGRMLIVDSIKRTTKAIAYGDKAAIPLSVRSVMELLSSLCVFPGQYQVSQWIQFEEKNIERAKFGWSAN